MNDIFPPNRPGGVSSAIVLSKNEHFALFTKPNYQGIQGQLKAGQWYETPTAMGFPNDARCEQQAVQPWQHKLTFLRSFTRNVLV